MNQYEVTDNTLQILCTSYMRYILRKVFLYYTIDKVKYRLSYIFPAPISNS